MLILLFLIKFAKNLRYFFEKIISVNWYFASLRLSLMKFLITCRASPYSIYVRIMGIASIWFVGGGKTFGVCLVGGPGAEPPDSEECWDNFENFWWKFNRKTELLLLLEYLLLKIQLLEITSFFYNNFFRFQGGDPPGYAHGTYSTCSTYIIV